MSSSEFLNYALGIAVIVGSAALVYVAFRIGEVCQASKTVLQNVKAVTEGGPRSGDKYCVVYQARAGLFYIKFCRDS